MSTCCRPSPVPYMLGKKMCALLLLLPFFCGCASMLPVGRSSAESPWQSFEAAKEAFDKITPHQTTRADLTELHFDPFNTPNVEILTYLEIMERFMPNTSITKEDLDQGLQECIAAKEECQAYEMKIHKTRAERHGSVFLDLFQFKRKTHHTGWEFSALLVLKGDIVVYKLWGGKPKIDAEIYRKNPLGPLQEPADAAKDAAVISTF